MQSMPASRIEFSSCSAALAVGLFAHCPLHSVSCADAHAQVATFKPTHVIQVCLCAGAQTRETVCLHNISEFVTLARQHFE